MNEADTKIGATNVYGEVASVTMIGNGAQDRFGYGRREELIRRRSSKMRKVCNEATTEIKPHLSINAQRP